MKTLKKEEKELRKEKGRIQKRLDELWLLKRDKQRKAFGSFAGKCYKNRITPHNYLKLLSFNGERFVYLVESFYSSPRKWKRYTDDFKITEFAVFSFEEAIIEGYREVPREEYEQKRREFFTRIAKPTRIPGWNLK